MGKRDRWTAEAAAGGLLRVGGPSSQPIQTRPKRPSLALRSTRGPIPCPIDPRQSIERFPSKERGGAIASTHIASVELPRRAVVGDFGLCGAERRADLVRTAASAFSKEGKQAPRSIGRRLEPGASRGGSEIDLGAAQTLLLFLLLALRPPRRVVASSCEPPPPAAAQPSSKQQRPPSPGQVDSHQAHRAGGAARSRAATWNSSSRLRSEQPPSRRQQSSSSSRPEEAAFLRRAGGGAGPLRRDMGRVRTGSADSQV